MELIVKESHRLSRILSDFLSFARVERTTLRNVELLHIIHDVVEIVYHSPSYHRGIDIDIRSDASAVYVVGDDNLVKQLLVNLALNACEAFDGRPGHLLFRIVSAPEGDEISLEIIDDGPGIDPEQQERIFQPFYSTKKQGTGLGLSIVHRICAALRLGLAVRSRVGEGTTFIVEFQPYSAGRQGDEPPTVASWHTTSAPAP
jgi:two-component system sensor histidine kinase PilS (NtrC family)